MILSQIWNKYKGNLPIYMYALFVVVRPAAPFLHVLIPSPGKVGLTDVGNNKEIAN